MRIGYLIGLFFLVSLTANAELATVQGPVKVSGSGCREGTYSVTLSPDNTDISILFDEYSAIVSPERPLFQHKKCQIRVPVHVTSGYRLKVKSEDYRGFVSLDSRKTKGFLFSQVSVKNGRTFSVTPLQFDRLKGPKEEDFLFARVGKYRPRGCSSTYELVFNSWFFVLAHWRDSSDSLLVTDSFDFSLDSDQVEITPCH